MKQRVQGDPRRPGGLPHDLRRIPPSRKLSDIGIKPLFNFDPPVTEADIRAASLQFVRKVNGFTKPSKANEQAFLGAVDQISGILSSLLSSLETSARRGILGSGSV